MISVKHSYCCTCSESIVTSPGYKEEKERGRQRQHRKERKVKKKRKEIKIDSTEDKRD